MEGMGEEEPEYSGAHEEDLFGDIDDL